MSHDDEADLVLQYLPVALHAIKRLNAPRSAKEDLVSDAQLALLQIIRQHDPLRGELRKTIFFQMPLRLIDLYRERCKGRSKFRQGVVVHQLSALAGRTPVDDRNPGADVDADDYFDWLASSLPPNERAVVVGYFRDGQRLVDIGRAIGRSESRCSQLLKGALQLLREQLSVSQSA